MKKKYKLKYRGTGFYEDTLIKVNRLAKKEQRSPNAIINILLKEALKRRKL